MTDRNDVALSCGTSERDYGGICHVIAFTLHTKVKLTDQAHGGFNNQLMITDE